MAMNITVQEPAKSVLSPCKSSLAIFLVVANGSSHLAIADNTPNNPEDAGWLTSSPIHPASSKPILAQLPQILRHLA